MMVIVGNIASKFVEWEVGNIASKFVEFWELMQQKRTTNNEGNWLRKKQRERAGAHE